MDFIDIYTIVAIGITLVVYPIEANKALMVFPQAGQALSIVFVGLFLIILECRRIAKTNIG